ncbi:MAG: fused MFS/spermidine synthase [Gammaproteobacteria bacterium]|nr:fused MFS/spermidine synthase [Gammaproteobacteria bacterium]MBT3988653.1 fused MFS/spermidine synthase [Gammaproteobacteria bacterium]MBT4580609.1 fused MFS/spermidine synthase [Gammaproteobacteria bacterium]MBT4657868.1 fused MFS/spermidine synthase [Gammaproteobacteria bacterium]MBT4891810.1 fused MFS/spermidine synthase [Gammaproteobacteria bacterium]
MKQARPAGLAWLFSVTIFLSAFLLFQVQPMIGKFILPWFGSTPGMWTTALMFFQLSLLGGYVYAHLLVSRVGWRRQAILHGGLLALALIVLPIAPVEALKPLASDAPIGRIFLILTLSVGAPFFLLSATTPLLQRWFAHLYPGKSPYRLFALSNFGSLLALLSYPFIVEPLFPLQVQSWIWSLAYVVFAVLCAACGWQFSRSRTEEKQVSVDAKGDNMVSQVDARNRQAAGAGLMWLLLSACGSGLLMATTNQMSIDIASVPFLWVVPLSIYLLTFILCFESERWYFRPLFSALLPLVMINTLRLLYIGEDLSIIDQLLGYSLTLFICCMCCHGELARLRPVPTQLTLFFLIVSVGGALGGMFVAILAPVIFTGFYEFHILLIMCYVLVVLAQLPGFFSSAPDYDYDIGKGVLIRVLSVICWAVVLGTIIFGAYYSFVPHTWSIYNPSSAIGAAFMIWQMNMALALPFSLGLLMVVLEIWRRGKGVTLMTWWGSNHGVARLGVSAVLTLGLVSLVGALNWQIQTTQSSMVEGARNFYGILSINERGIGDSAYRLALNNGRIRHGEQHQLYPTWPTTYFGPETGIGVAIINHPARSDTSRQFRVGVVGLGAGTLAAYANTHIDLEGSKDSYVTTRDVATDDYLRFYELNPRVVQWATEYFTFLQDASSRGADIDVFEGDARIVLEHQLRQGNDQHFDVLAIDAFSSDAIPIHLLTLESIQIYLEHLNEDGILALHVTNRYVDLVPIVARLAEAVGMEAIYIENYANTIRFVDSTEWILLTHNRAFLENEAVYVNNEPMPAPGSLWTDDFSSLFETIQLQF